MWSLIVSVPDHCLSFYFPINEEDNSKIRMCIPVLKLK